MWCQLPDTLTSLWIVEMVKQFFSSCSDSVQVKLTVDVYAMQPL